MSDYIRRDSAAGSSRVTQERSAGVRAPAEPGVWGWRFRFLIGLSVWFGLITASWSVLFLIVISCVLLAQRVGIL